MILTLVDEDFLHVEHVITVMTVLAAVLTVCRACIPDEVSYYLCQVYLKVSQSLYYFTTSISRGVENYFPRQWGTGISDAILQLNIEVKLNVLTISSTLKNFVPFSALKHLSFFFFFFICPFSKCLSQQQIGLLQFPVCLSQ